MNVLPKVFQRISPKIYKSPLLWVFIATLAALAIHPIPECVDCEYTHPWGRSDATYVYASRIFDTWLIVASFTAGVCSLRRYWAMPLVIVFADLVTQPRGGVALWSLWSNEGPVIVVVGAVVGGSAVLVGGLVRLVVARLQVLSS
jgi:hypothetical protein